MIEFKHLCKKYPNVTPLKDVNAKIERGEVISIIGPSGTGKSTLLRCLNRLETPTSGEIWVDGVNMCDPSTDLSKVRQKMGMVFQSFNLFAHKTVIENIMMAPMDLLKISRQEAYDEGMRLLKMVGLSEKALNYPNELSGGQKQRVAIARALAMKPEIILFDEPTSALDPTMVSEVLAVISELAKQGLTMMIVTHEMRFARDVSTRIFYMDEGIIYEDGTPEQIFDNPQKEQTRNFIYRIKNWTYTIDRKDFDIYSMIGNLKTFCTRQFLNDRQQNTITLVLEELVENRLLKACGDSPDIKLEFSCGENGGKAELKATYSELDPMLEEFSDKLSDSIIQHYLKLTNHDKEKKLLEFEVIF
ncbi:MAG: amino acid ABC transporter ATP-binding protein [Treponema sp.]|nr:amino acid ABC transporter ATP-binding protein [Candidatus Treponema equifaecale]